MIQALEEKLLNFKWSVKRSATNTFCTNLNGYYVIGTADEDGGAIRYFAIRTGPQIPGNERHEGLTEDELVSLITQSDTKSKEITTN